MKVELYPIQKIFLKFTKIKIVLYIDWVWMSTPLVWRNNYPIAAYQVLDLNRRSKLKIPSVWNLDDLMRQKLGDEELLVLQRVLHLPRGDHMTCVAVVSSDFKLDVGSVRGRSGGVRNLYNQRWVRSLVPVYYSKWESLWQQGWIIATQYCEKGLASSPQALSWSPSFFCVQY